MIDVFVGIGSNIRPQVHIPQVLALLDARFSNLRVSSAYRCPAVGFDGADFINLVVGFTTTADVYAVHEELRAIEAACGRERGDKRALARSMDLDLLLYGDSVLDSERLRLPRADIIEYAFVLRPLAELIPRHRHPVLGRRYEELWEAFDDREQPLTAIDLGEPVPD